MSELEQIKSLRSQTGYPIMIIRNALRKSGGDPNEALKIIRQEMPGYVPAPRTTRTVVRPRVDPAEQAEDYQRFLDDLKTLERAGWRLVHQITAGWRWVQS